jgi:hypothetical protein
VEKNASVPNDWPLLRIENDASHRQSGQTGNVLRVA